MIAKFDNDYGVLDEVALNHLGLEFLRNLRTGHPQDLDAAEHRKIDISVTVNGIAGHLLGRIDRRTLGESYPVRYDGQVEEVRQLRILAVDDYGQLVARLRLDQRQFAMTVLECVVQVLNVSDIRDVSARTQHQTCK